MNVIGTIKRHRDLSTLRDLRQSLEAHPVFRGLRSPEHLRRFMHAHVFAVWDFMSLLKRLQRDLTCIDVPWVPREDRIAAHLINEIVRGEESDLGPDGAPASHLEIYLDAMREVGADTLPFQQFLTLVSTGSGVELAFAIADVPEYVRRFVNHTLRVAEHGSTLEVMGAFFHGRENVIPAMFQSLLGSWKIDESDAPMFVFYLKRHIEVDGDFHGPMAQRIIDRLCASDPDRQEAVLVRAAIESVRARIELWDGVSASLREVAAA